MEQTNIQILGCKITAKQVSADYHDNRDSYNYTVENNEFPHPDLHNAMKAFKSDLAESHYILGSEQDEFVPGGFQISEKKGKFYVTVTGKLATFHGDKVNVSSGKIPTTEGDLEDKLKTLREELFNYFFNGKTAQGDLFKDQKKKEGGKKK